LKLIRSRTQRAITAGFRRFLQQQIDCLTRLPARAGDHHRLACGDTAGHQHASVLQDSRTAGEELRARRLTIGPFAPGDGGLWHIRAHPQPHT